jgi:hypothetical protein
MGNQYRTEHKGGNLCGTGLTPTREYVVDKESGERVGEISRWEYEKAGELIEKGEWEPYDEDD